MAKKITLSRRVGFGLIVLGTIALVAASLFVTRIANKHAKKKDPTVTRSKGLPMPVSLHTIAQREVVEYLFTSARIAASSEPALYPSKEARVKKIHVTDGARVEAGDVLIELDTTELDNELAADLLQAKGARDKQALAQLTLERSQALRAQGLSSETELAQARTQLLEAELAVSKTEAEADRVKRSLTYMTIRAPARGIVRDIIDEGWKQVSPNTRVVDFVATDNLVVYGTLPEEYLPLLTPGMEALITVPAFPGETFAGQVEKTAPIADPLTRSAPVKISLTTSSPRLVPGMTAQARLAFTAQGPAMPLIALFNRNGREGSTFWVKDGVAELRALRLGRISAEWVEVLDGLKVGEVIVQSGQLYLKNGDKVAEAK